MHGKNICDAALSNLPSDGDPVGRFHILTALLSPPHARGDVRPCSFNGSHDVHMFAGDCKDAAAARKMGS